jgi:hypothetical protein
MRDENPRRHSVRLRTLALAVLALALSACSALALGNLDIIQGNGTVRLESRDAPSFSGIENQGPGLVRFSQGPTRLVTVETDANLLSYIETEVRNGILVLRTRPGVSIKATRLVFRITAPDLRTVGIEGCGNFRTETPVDADRLEIEIEGSGSFEGDIVADTLAAGINGSGGIQLSGIARRAQFEINGSGGIKAADFAVVDAQVVIRGSGSITLQATGTLDVDIGGSGDVRYRGSAKLSVRDSGSGRVTEF